MIELKLFRLILVGLSFILTALPVFSYPRAALVWRSPNLAGPVYGSPLINDGQIFIGTTDEAGTFYALGKFDGSITWPTPPTTGGPIYSSPSSQPAAGKVFVGSDSKKVFNFDMSSGRAIEVYNTSGTVRTTPLVFNTQVIVSSMDAVLYGFDILSGNLQWKNSLGCTVLSSPVVYGQSNIFFTCDGKVYAIDSNTRDPIWGMPFDTSSSLATTPEIDPDTGVLYVGDSTGKLWALNSQTGSEVWSINLARNAIQSRPRVATTNSGRKLILVGSDDNNLYAVDPNTAATIYTVITKDNIRSTPWSYNGMAYFVSCDGNIYAIRIDDGYVEWTYPLDSTKSSISKKNSSPTGYQSIATGEVVVVVGSTDGHVYAVKNPLPPPSSSGGLSQSEVIGLATGIPIFVVGAGIGVTQICMEWCKTHPSLLNTNYGILECLRKCLRPNCPCC